MLQKNLAGLLCVCATAALAQPVRNLGLSNDGQGEREQRRMDIRNAVQKRQTLEASPMDVSIPPGKHLSQREAAEMRELLRQQQKQGRVPRP